VSFLEKFETADREDEQRQPGARQSARPPLPPGCDIQDIPSTVSGDESIDDTFSCDEMSLAISAESDTASHGVVDQNEIQMGKILIPARL
jgi:hypothetical protein